VLILLLVGLVALCRPWRISGFASWSPGAVPMFAASSWSLRRQDPPRHARVTGPDTSTDARPRAGFSTPSRPPVVIWFTLLIVFYISRWSRWIHRSSFLFWSRRCSRWGTESPV